MKHTKAEAVHPTLLFEKMRLNSSRILATLLHFFYVYVKVKLNQKNFGFEKQNKELDYIEHRV